MIFTSVPEVGDWLPATLLGKFSGTTTVRAVRTTDLSWATHVITVDDLKGGTTDLHINVEYRTGWSRST